MDNTNQVFPSELSLGFREWGEEVLLALVSGKFSVKRITMNKGSRGGLQFHRQKDEVAVMIEGEMIVRYANDRNELVERVVGPGDVIHFSPGLVHQTEAISRVVYFEASTPHFNDRVRVEDQFGFEHEPGLPSTQESEIEIW